MDHLEDEKAQQILVGGGYVTQETFDSASKNAKQYGVSVVEQLIQEGLLSPDLFGQAVAESYGVPYADLNSNQPSSEQVQRIPEEIAKQFNAVLFKESEKEITVTSFEPLKEGLEAAFTKLFPNKKITITYSLPEDISQSHLAYQKALDTRFSQIIEKKDGREALEILEEIFEDAYTFKASDIHFEPQKENVRVRFRVDGVMHEAGKLPKQFYENILNRIKVQSRLRIDEHFATQDGSFRHENGKHSFDMRTSIVPTVEGEKVVLRILAAYVQGFSLSDLGLSLRHQKMLQEASKKPFGMILMTGPTGSGKTTTLYAMLKYVQKPEVNITTIEDPVEYKIAGANQIQVNPRTDLTFAKGLRSIVRQDPDVILVGEIRDTETAEIAVNAALTGHLLFSTFHANDAATAIPRLLDMNVEPFLLASTLELVAAQRLVRKICEHCRYSVSVPMTSLKKEFPHAAPYFSGKDVTLYAGKGCGACGNTGYSGRTAIHEFIIVDAAMQDLILNNPSARDIWKLAAKQHAQPLFYDGVEKVKAGITTLEELLRVAAPPED